MNEALAKALDVRDDASVDRILMAAFWRPRQGQSAEAQVVRLPLRSRSEAQA